MYCGKNNNKIKPDVCSWPNNFEEPRASPITSLFTQVSYSERQNKEPQYRKKRLDHQDTFFFTYLARHHLLSKYGKWCTEGNQLQRGY